MPVDVYVLTASGRLVAHAGRIRAHVHAAATSTFEEVGLGGFAPDGHTVFLALDPDHEHFERALEREVFRTLAHEFHHVARHRASLRGHTLLDALVSEGLADHFSIEVTGMEPPPWAVALDLERTAAMSDRARAEYDNPRYDHRAWFFGSTDVEIPRWTGYTLGFQIVADYLERHPGSSAAALAMMASETLRPA